jgi:CheY-like chemotaxis protein
VRVGFTTAWRGIATNAPPGHGKWIPAEVTPQQSQVRRLSARQEEGAMTSQKTIHVLVVEDEPSIRGSLSRLLEDRGFVVSSAETGEEALELFKETQVDVAIVDIQLPGMDGDDMILKAHEIRPQLRYVIFTGSMEFQLPPSLENLGLCLEDVLLKPLPHLDMLVNAIHQVLGRGRSSMSL